MNYGDFSNPKGGYNTILNKNYLAQQSVEKLQAGSTFCNDRLNSIIGGVDFDIKSAFDSAMTDKREYGGIIIQKENEIKVNKIERGRKGVIYLSFNNIQETYEIAGEFHTHQYSVEEVEAENKGRKSKSFDGNGVGFDSQDLVTIKKRAKKGYTAIIEAGNTRFALVVYNPELAELFLLNQRNDSSDYSVDAEVDNNLDWDLEEGKVEGDYTKLRWDRFKQLLTKYESDTKRKIGIEFYKSINADKTKFESTDTCG